MWHHRPAATAAALALLLGATLPGCTVGPDFSPPKPDTPAAWTDTAIAPLPGQQNVVDPSPVAVAAWWASFQDPTLTVLIERAAASNLDLRQAVLRIAEARAQRDIASSGFWPSLDANGSYTRQRVSDKTALTSLLAGHGTSAAPPGLENPFNQYQYGFDASWEIDLFGRIRRSVEAADADGAASVENSRDVLVSLVGEVARIYIDLRGAQLRLTILEDNLKTQRDALDLARDRRNAGTGIDLDVANAAAEVASTEARIPTAKTQIAVDINQLSFLLALEPDALRAELAAARPVPPVPPQVPVGLPADLVRRRPDIRTAEAELHAATARVGVAVADLFPRLTLNADFGLQAARSGDLGNWASRFFAIGPSLDIPIFSGGRRQANVRLQDVKAKEAAVAYARTVLAAIHEVENALAAYGPEQTRRASLQTSVAQDREALSLATQRYASGITTFLDVLDAERNLEQAELSLADSTVAVSTDLVAVYKALGGGWDQLKIADNETAAAEATLR
ncbi:MAG TPA: efflux transporter outer membrane subunit [Alphaproteobacteria bacterium]|nr:efflux transporter outer membrane subunit [Alphaproteobacteria bacterium]